ncbi:MAG: hypothetical protein ACJ8F3_10025 [Xanthobacteraceae bacterium]
MLTAKEYRHQALECLELAEESDELYVKEALLELAAEFQAMADFLDHEQQVDASDRRADQRNRRAS